MLAGAGFGDHAGFTHAFGHQALADGIVDFVGTRVIQIFPLEIDLCSTDLLGQSGSECQAAWPAHVIP